MTGYTRRRVLRWVAAGSGSLVAGCTGGGETTTATTVPTTRVPLPPYAGLIYYRTNAGLKRLANPWFYTERFTDGDPIEGVSRPVWICVFGTELESRGTPTGDQPYRNFELDGGSVEPIQGTEPTNDTYVVLKKNDDDATMTFLAHRGEEPARLYFNEEVLFDTDEVDPGATFDIPPF